MGLIDGSFQPRPRPHARRAHSQNPPPHQRCESQAPTGGGFLHRSATRYGFNACPRQSRRGGHCVLESDLSFCSFLCGFQNKSKLRKVAERVAKKHKDEEASGRAPGGAMDMMSALRARLKQRQKAMAGKVNSEDAR